MVRSCSRVSASFCPSASRASWSGDEVSAEEKPVLGQDAVERKPGGRREWWPGQEAAVIATDAPGQSGRHGYAQLVDQAGGYQLVVKVGPAFTEHGAGPNVVQDSQ